MGKARGAAIAAGSVAATGAAALAWAALVEVRWFALRRVQAPVLPRGDGPSDGPITVLHISDLHLMPDQRRKREWVRGLAALKPDLVVNTGDNISSAASVGPLLDTLGPLLNFPGVFVSGSNDYFAPRPKNPIGYLFGSSKMPAGGPPPSRHLPTREMDGALERAGWLNLRNARGSLTVRGRSLEFAGVDDPHLGLDRYRKIAGGFSPDAALRIGVTHAPYRRVLDAMAGDGARLILAGHTHGGQVCLPGFGALVTNCDLDRRRAKGLSRWPVPPSDGAGSGRGCASDDDAWLNVSAGLGTSPFAPIRFSCRPEATLLTLTEG